MKIIIFISLFLEIFCYSQDSNKLSKMVDDLFIKSQSVCSNLIVSKFDYINNKKSPATLIIQERIITSFGKKNIKLIERSQIEKIFEEYKIQSTGMIDSKTISEIGKITGADCILVGTINDKTSDSVEINSRIVKVADGGIIATAVSSITKDWSEEKKKENSQIIENITFEPTSLGSKVDIGDFKPLVKINFTDEDISIMEEYDKIFEIDNDVIIKPLEKAQKWLEFGKKYAKYLDFARDRSNYWIEYENKIKELERFKEERDKALDNDWSKLKRLLNLKSVSINKKTEWVFSFLNAYGWNEKQNKFFEQANRFLPTPCLIGNMGMCYYDGSAMIEGKYARVFPFKYGIAKIQRADGLYFYVDINGKNISRFNQNGMEYVRYFYWANDFNDDVTVIKGNKENDYYSIVDKNGNIVADYLFYDWVSGFENGFAKIEENKKYGLIDKSGKVVVTPKYDEIYEFDGLYYVKLNKKKGVLNKNFKEIIKPIYDDILTVSPDFFQVESAGKFGIIDINGIERIDTKYEKIYFLDNFFIVEINGKDGVLSLNGSEIIPAKYEKITVLDKGLICVEDKKKFGAFNLKGEEIVPIKYDNLSYNDGVFVVSLANKWGFIDKNGKVLVPPKYDKAGNFKEGLVPVFSNIYWGFVDKNGNEVIPFKYYDASDFSQGLAVVCLDKCGCIDKRNNIVIPFKYDLISNFEDGVAIFELNRKYGILDKTGKEILSPKYDNIDEFYEGFANVYIGKKIGLIDKTGKEIVRVKYDEIAPFYKGFSEVKINGKKGIVNIDGKEVVPPIYDNVSVNHEGGIIILESKNKKTFVDFEGNFISKNQYDAGYFSDGLISVKIGDKWGYLDRFAREYFPSN